MKLLLHICCGPCAIFPVSLLREQGIGVTGYFFNPNIHPLTEFRKRLRTAADYADSIDLPMAIRDEYLLKEFLRGAVFEEENRCLFCYEMRLRAAAKEAVEQGADAFSTTLLYSIYQKHGAIRQMGEKVSGDTGVPFYYQDFRPGWKEGVRLSRDLGLYRQRYCGCIFSEMERYGNQSPEDGGRRMKPAATAGHGDQSWGNRPGEGP